MVSHNNIKSLLVVVYTYTYIYIYIERERYRDRQRKRERERESERARERESEREIHMHVMLRHSMIQHDRFVTAFWNHEKASEHPWTVRKHDSRRKLQNDRSAFSSRPAYLSLLLQFHGSRTSCQSPCVVRSIWQLPCFPGMFNTYMNYLPGMFIIIFPGMFIIIYN